MRNEKIDKIDLAKYLMVCLLVIYVVFLIVREGNSSVSVDAIEQNILKSAEMTGTTKASMQELKKYYGLNGKEYDGVCLYIPDDVMSVTEILVVKVKDKSQIESVEQAMEERLETQKKSFEGYGVTQTKLLRSAVLESKGYYVLLAVSEEAAQIEAAFKKSI